VNRSKRQYGVANADLKFFSHLNDGNLIPQFQLFYPLIFLLLIPNVFSDQPCVSAHRRNKIASAQKGFVA
jgi:hypothetical protein